MFWFLHDRSQVSTSQEGVSSMQSYLSLHELLPPSDGSSFYRPGAVSWCSRGRWLWWVLDMAQQWKQLLRDRGSELVFKCLLSSSCWSMRFRIKGKVVLVDVRYGTSECGDGSVGSSSSVVTLYKPG